MKNVLKYILVAVLSAFGLLTLFLSTSVIFDLFGIRAKEGNYVLFVVAANFLASLGYLIAAVGIIKSRQWATKLLAFATVILLAAFVALMFHVNAGGLYETKTIGAMIFRTSLTLLFTLSAYFLLSRSGKIN
jgi:5-carboxymethyl-2-hydroxymuconate isomerase